MARQRWIHPDFWEDEKLAQQLSIQERYLFIGLFSNADDEGRIVATPAALRSTIFRYDDLTLDEVRTMRDRVCNSCRNVLLYQVDGVDYIALLKWRTYQNPKYPRPSRLPPPPEDLLQARGGGEQDRDAGSPVAEKMEENVSSKIEEGFPEDFSKMEETFLQNSAKPGSNVVDDGLGLDPGLGSGREILRTSGNTSSSPPRTSLGINDGESAALRKQINEILGAEPKARAADKDPPEKTQKTRTRRTIDYTAEFECFWQAYLPERRVCKGEAFAKFKARLNDGVKPGDLVGAARAYTELCRREGREPRHIKHASRFLAPEGHWKDFLPGGALHGKVRPDPPNRGGKYDAINRKPRPP